jgi:hypothetical protein
MVTTNYKVTYQYKFGEQANDYIKFFDCENKAFQFVYSILDKDIEALNLSITYDLTLHEAVMLIDSFMKTVNPSNFYILMKQTIHYAV